MEPDSLGMFHNGICFSFTLTCFHPYQGTQ